jgi:hypothetical protein
VSADGNSQIDRLGSVVDLGLGSAQMIVGILGTVLVLVLGIVLFFVADGEVLWLLVEFLVDDGWSRIRGRRNGTGSGPV